MPLTHKVPPGGLSLLLLGLAQLTGGLLGHDILAGEDDEDFRCHYQCIVTENASGINVK